MPECDPKKRANRALDAANFFLADVRDGLGPYLAVYLLTEQQWDEARIGVVMSVATIAGIVAQTPAGALVDATQRQARGDGGRRHHRDGGLTGAAAASRASGRSRSRKASRMRPASIFPPAIAAVSLGIVGHRAFTRRIGRNETFNHAGNASRPRDRGRHRLSVRARPSCSTCSPRMSLASLVSMLGDPGTRHRPRSRARPA